MPAIGWPVVNHSTQARYIEHPGGRRASFDLVKLEQNSVANRG
jgi:hypothetical protein